MFWVLLVLFVVGSILVNLNRRLWFAIGILAVLGSCGLSIAGWVTSSRVSEQMSGLVSTSDVMVDVGKPITLTVTIENPTRVDFEEVYISIGSDLATVGSAIGTVQPPASKEMGPLIWGVAVPISFDSLGRTLVFDGPTSHKSSEYQIQLIGIVPGEYNSTVRLAFEGIGWGVGSWGLVPFEEEDLKIIVLP